MGMLEADLAVSNDEETFDILSWFEMVLQFLIFRSILQSPFTLIDP